MKSYNEESLAIIMSFDLHSSFRTFVSFSYHVKDSDNCFDDSTLNVLSCFNFFADYFC